MQNTLISDLRKALGRDNILSAPSELAVYRSDAATSHGRQPAAVVFPQSTDQTAEVVELCGRHGAPILARGAGSDVDGGCVPQASGVVVLSFARMNRILEIDLDKRMAVVEAGVCHGRLAEALAGSGYRFAPNPLTQASSTLGGEAATNAAGPNAVRYGSMANHVLGLEIVLGDGTVMQLGPRANPTDPDDNLIGLLVGSRGVLSIITKLWLRLTPAVSDRRTLRAVFASSEAADEASRRIRQSGLLPSVLELVDPAALSAVQSTEWLGIPRDAAAVMLLEIEGDDGLDRRQEQIIELCQQAGAVEAASVLPDQHHELLWQCRKVRARCVEAVDPETIHRLRAAFDPAGRFHSRGLIGYGDPLATERFQETLRGLLATGYLDHKDDRPQTRIVRAIRDRFNNLS